MSRKIKQEIVSHLEENLKTSKGIYFTNYSGLNVSQMTDLRNQFRNENVAFKISKNTLTKIAFKNVDMASVDDILVGQVAIAYSFEDASAPARVIKKFAKENENLEVLGIIFEGKRFEGVEFEKIATLPSREELYSKLLSGLSQPMSSLASTLNGAMGKLVGVLENLKSTKS